jgi:hypothetical protein
MAGGGSEEDFSSLPVYNDQADLDYAVRKGQIGSGDRVRMGNSIYMYEHDAGWQRVRTLPPGTFADPVTGTTPGILNPLPTGTPVTGGITYTGGITDPNYKSLGEYLVGPTYTGPTTADEYVMQRAGGPAWDYAYPMHLGSGGYGPGGSLPTVTSTGDLTITTPITDTTIDTTTDTTTTTTTDDDDTIIREGPQSNNDFGIDNFRWNQYTNNAAGVPMFPTTNQGATDYERYISGLRPGDPGLGNPFADDGGQAWMSDPNWGGFSTTGIPGSGLLDLPSRWRRGLESKNSAQIEKELQMDEDWGPIGPAVDLGAGSLMGNQTQAAALTPQQIDAVMAGTATQEPTSFFETAAPAAQPVAPTPPVVQQVAPVVDIGLQAAIAAQNAQIQQQQEIDRQRLQRELSGLLGRDERDESRLAQVQAALDQFEDMQGTGLLGSVRDERGFEERSPGAAIDRSDRGSGPF